MMRNETGRPDDPLWVLTLEIASKLWFYGEYVFDLDPHPHQRLVNVRWAALQAGRLLGVRAKTTVTGPLSRTDPTVTVTITFDDPDGRTRVRAQEGFDALLRSVREQHRR
jgi:hypothetical protein